MIIIGAIHAIFFIRNTVEFQLVLFLKFSQNLTSFVAYLLLIFLMNLHSLLLEKQLQTPILWQITYRGEIQETKGDQTDCTFSILRLECQNSAKISFWSSHLLLSQIIRSMFLMHTYQGQAKFVSKHETLVIQSILL